MAVASPDGQRRVKSEERIVKRSRCFAQIKKIYHTVGTGLAPVLNKLHINSLSRTTAFSASLV